MVNGNIVHLFLSKIFCFFWQRDTTTRFRSSFLFVISSTCVSSYILTYKTTYNTRRFCPLSHFLHNPFRQIYSLVPFKENPSLQNFLIYWNFSPFSTFHTRRSTFLFRTGLLSCRTHFWSSILSKTEYVSLPSSGYVYPIPVVSFTVHSPLSPFHSSWIE